MVNRTKRRKNLRHYLYLDREGSKRFGLFTQPAAIFTKNKDGSSRYAQTIFRDPTKGEIVRDKLNLHCDGTGVNVAMLSESCEYRNLRIGTDNLVSR